MWALARPLCLLQATARQTLPAAVCSLQRLVQARGYGSKYGDGLVATSRPIQDYPELWEPSHALRSKEEIYGAVEALTGHSITVMNLQYLLDAGRNLDVQQAVGSAQFVQQEMCLRLAHIIKEIDCLPKRLLESPRIEQVKNWYLISFKELMEYRPVHSQPEETWPDELRDFNFLLTNITARHAPVVMAIARGILDLKREHGPEFLEQQMRYFLDRIYMSRIGIRLLAKQHMESTRDLLDNRKSDTMAGLIDSKCRIADVVKDAYANAKILCKQHYNGVPELIVEVPEGRGDYHITYIPSHLYHMCFELLKNSMRAVVEEHRTATALPPIHVWVVRGHDDVTIKISDLGGGIPRKDMPYVNSYLYTTAVAPTVVEDREINKAPLAGFGYGLPLSRLYARYLGGELTLVSAEGFGTDSYIQIKTSACDSVEVLPQYSPAAMKHYSAKHVQADWLTSLPVGA